MTADTTITAELKFDRADLVVRRAVNCGWITADQQGLDILQQTIRIALDMEVADALRAVQVRRSSQVLRAHHTGEQK